MSLFSLGLVSKTCIVVDFFSDGISVAWWEERERSSSYTFTRSGPRLENFCWMLWREEEEEDLDNDNWF